MISTYISTDTHFYDSHLQQVITTKKDINDNEKKEFLKIIIEIMKKLNQFQNIIGPIKYYNVINTIKLFITDVHNNYDEINKIRLELLLPKIWNNIINKDHSVLIMFFEQMADIIVSGPCAQGRITRLIQFINL